MVGWCGRVIPPDSIAHVRDGIVRGSQLHREHSQEITKGKAVEAMPDRIRELLESKLAELEPKLKASADRSETIQLLDGVSAELRAEGVEDLYEFEPAQSERAPLPSHEIAHFPEFADHLTNPRLLDVVRGV